MISENELLSPEFALELARLRAGLSSKPSEWTKLVAFFRGRMKESIGELQVIAGGPVARRIRPDIEYHRALCKGVARG